MNADSLRMAARMEGIEPFYVMDVLSARGPSSGRGTG